MQTPKNAQKKEKHAIKTDLQGKEKSRGYNQEPHYPPPTRKTREDGLEWKDLKRGRRKETLIKPHQQD